MTSLPQTPSRHGRSDEVASPPSTPSSTDISSAASSPSSPFTTSRTRTEVVTTSTRTRNTRYGVEVRTKTRTVTTFTGGRRGSLAPPPSPSPLPRNQNRAPINSNAPTITVYLPRSPSSLVYFLSPKYYVLTGGEDAGIFKTWDDIKLRTEGSALRIVELRFDWEEAVTVYTIAFNEGSILLEPNPNGPFSSVNTAIQRRINTSEQPLPVLNGIPEPRSLQCPFSLGKYYVVFKGEEVGVWGVWHQAAARTVKVNGYCSKYDSWTAALKAYTDAFKARTLRVISRVGGPFGVRREAAAQSSDPFM
ncbi:hypothetical protein GALMADRAFT_148609 [Galerina marginata CBS 339.88]|uniref:Uncharacterized protein n=1 Tax=Galerina marginata (strain CBS 339.88) TaxID=685588 RepID=A0A067SCT3_GALM3|nr:hypothetical protein GALMADRAFT_148609 [Galerina marginata CBS 339.88]